VALRVVDDRPAKRQSGGGIVEIVLKNDRRVRVCASADLQFVSRLVAELERLR
jgi:hypothetical protein